MGDNSIFRTCTHVRCYATRWDGDDDVPCTCTHVGWNMSYIIDMLPTRKKSLCLFPQASNLRPATVFEARRKQNTWKNKTVCSTAAKPWHKTFEMLTPHRNAVWAGSPVRIEVAGTCGLIFVWQWPSSSKLHAFDLHRGKLFLRKKLDIGHQLQTD